MSGLSRRRGQGFEREIAAILSRVGPETQRNLGQERDSGYDIDWRYFAIECKRTRSLGYVEKWLGQVESVVPLDGTRVPVVVARQDGSTPVVIMRLEHWLDLLGSIL